MPVTQQPSTFHALFWSILGGGSTGASLFFFNVVAARSLGRIGYADLAFAVVLGTAWSLIALAGIDLAVSRMLACSMDRPARGRILGSALVLMAVSTLVAAASGVLLAPVIADAADIPRSLVLAACGTGVIVGIRNILERAMSALGAFRVQSLIKGMEAIIVIGASIVVASREFEIAGEPATALLFAMFAAGCIAVVTHARVVAGHAEEYRITRAGLRELASYARFAFGAVVLTNVLMYADKFFLKFVASDATYGLYVAYYTGSLMVAVQASLMLQNVLLPAGATMLDRRAFLRRLDRLFVLGSVPALGASMAGLAIVLFAFGPQFPFHFREAVMFAAWAVLYGANIAVVSVLTPVSADVMRRESRFAALRVVFMLLGFALLVALDAATIPALVILMFTVEVMEALNLRRIAASYVEG